MSDHPRSPRQPRAERHASPFRLNLEQQRKRAKELLKGLRAGEADALCRFRRHHPRLADANAPTPGDLARLSEAQLVLARELGLPSWARLKAHIEAMDRTWRRLQGHVPAPDRGMTTLHLRCGSDIDPGLKQAGFTGDFLEYSDPLCQGPLTAGPDWLERRADFVASAYGQAAGRGRDEIEAELQQAEEDLRSAALRYERIVLWFERDSYDQLILARCLARFAERPPQRLELVSPAHYPGGVRFIGLGQLPPEALRLLWDERQPVAAAALATGRAAWEALRARDPRPLAALAASGTPDLPPLATALRRHCQELPWTIDGLGLTERLILQLLAERSHSAGRVYAQLMLEREPLPWMSDLIFHHILCGLRQVAQPVLLGPCGAAPQQAWTQEHLSITALGRAVLAGEVDWLSLAPPPRWLGGVPITSTSPVWRWDDRQGAIVER